MQAFKPVFPTRLHHDAANIINDFFIKSKADSVLVVNSCARGQAVPESDLDFCILVNENTSDSEMAELNRKWLYYSTSNPILLKYAQSTPFAHLHVDIIDGIYTPALLENGEPIDDFEVEIGNQICYSTSMQNGGRYFKELQERWMPYYEENMRLERLQMAISACNYDLKQVPILVNRELYFHAFDTLYKAFQKYLQALFISNRTYPIAYNKWIKYQFTDLLKRPDLYPLLGPVLSINNLESNEIIHKVCRLSSLLNSL